MANIDIDQLAPWDLTLTIGGRPVATRPPRWADVRRLAALEQAAQAGAQSETLEAELRKAMGTFCDASAAAVFEAASYDTLLAALAAVSSYFGEWIKKKRDSAIAAARAALAPHPPAAVPGSTG